MSLYQLPINGRSPWDAAPYSYAGWVPTITGQLSFSLIGSGGLRPRCTSCNKLINSATRVVIAHQRRTAQDFPLPSGLVGLLWPSMSQDYWLLANTSPANRGVANDDSVRTVYDSQGALTGQLFVAGRENNPILEKRKKRLVKRVRQAFANEGEAPEKILEQVQKDIREAHLGGVNVLAIDFALFRTGEFRAWFSMESFLGRQVHQGAIPPEPQELDAAIAVPPQAYYFIKDVTHVHYHHDPNSDQLLPLVRLHRVASSEVHTRNELAWRRETLWGLARVVMQFRRRRKLHEHKKARGVLAYAESFQSNLGAVCRGTDLDSPFDRASDLVAYDFGHTRTSVEAMEDLGAWRKSGWIQLFAVMAGVFLSSLALWGAALQIRPVICQPAGRQPVTSLVECPPIEPSMALDSALWIAENPIIFLSIIFVAGFAIFVAIFRDPTFVPFGRWFVKFTSFLSKALGASAARLATRHLGSAADWFGYFAEIAVLSFFLALVVYSALRVLI